MDEQLLKLYEKEGKSLPSHQPHGTEADIKDNMVQLKPSSWRQEGNQLIGETDMGPLVQTVPTSHILIGTDDKGMPVFKQIA